MKALLAGFIGIKDLKAHGIDSHVLKLIKELFQIRVADKNDMHCEQFNDLVKAAFDEIKKS